MSMVTTCPACGTMFKIQPDALATHGGEGRCSVCHHVFNALEHMTPIRNVAAPSADIAESVSTAPALVDQTIANEAPLDVADPSEPPIPVFAALPKMQPADLPDDLFQKKRFSWLSFLKPLSAVMLLIMIALVQTSLFFRTQIVSHAPSLYPALSSLCGVFSCTVPIPSQAKLITIEDYSLHSHPDYTDVLILESTLHNRASFMLAHPLLHLTLTDDFNVPVAQRMFKPAEYLPETPVPALGMKDNASVSIQLYLGVSGVKSSKYKLVTQDTTPDTPEASS